jgi:hypothetical protein
VGEIHRTLAVIMHRMWGSGSEFETVSPGLATTTPELDVAIKGGVVPVYQEARPEAVAKEPASGPSTLARLALCPMVRSA